MLDLREQFLLYRIRTRQDRKAFEELFIAHKSQIYRYIRCKVRTEFIAEDILSETFLAVWNYARQQRVRSFKAFVYQVARNNIAGHYRKQEKQAFSADMLEYDRESDEDIEKDIQTKEEYELLIPLLDKLNGTYSDILRMRFMDQMEIQEIADALGKTHNNVSVTIHRAIASLKTQVDIQTHENKRNQKPSVRNEE